MEMRLICSLEDSITTVHGSYIHTGYVADHNNPALSL